MTENREGSTPEAEKPAPQTLVQAQKDPIGGEIHVRSGGTPRWLRWSIYFLYAWAIVYLVVHPPVEHREILLIFAGLITAWLLFFAFTKRPPEL